MSTDTLDRAPDAVHDHGGDGFLAAGGLAARLAVDRAGERIDRPKESVCFAVG